MPYHKQPAPARVPGRLVRFTDLPGNFVCVFDEIKNLLQIDRTNYDMLSPRDQTRVFRARESVVITFVGKRNTEEQPEPAEPALN